MNAQLLPSYQSHRAGISEFAKKPDGTWWRGTCTWAALEACYAAIQNRAPSQASMAAMALDGLKRGYCTSSNGATRLDLIAAYARNRLGLGSRILLQWNYQEPLQGDWHSVLDTNAGKHAILMQVAHGARLIDIETGIRDEAAANGLAYHALACVGKQADGYLFVDGDHPQAASRLQVYAYDMRGPDGAVVNSLRAAVPCGLLMLKVDAPALVRPPAPPSPVKPPTPPTPPASPATPVQYRAVLQNIAVLCDGALKA